MKFHNVFSGSAGWGKILETPNLNEGGVGEYIGDPQPQSGIISLLLCFLHYSSESLVTQWLSTLVTQCSTLWLVLLTFLMIKGIDIKFEFLALLC